MHVDIALAAGVKAKDAEPTIHYYQLQVKLFFWLPWWDAQRFS